jgi:hypothetical protein
MSWTVLATLAIVSSFPFAAPRAAQRSSEFTVQVTIVPSCDITTTAPPLVRTADLARVLRETIQQRFLRIDCHPVVPYNIVVDTWTPRSTVLEAPCAAAMGSNKSPSSSVFGPSPGDIDTRDCNLHQELVATVVY